MDTSEINHNHSYHILLLGIVTESVIYDVCFSTAMKLIKGKNLLWTKVLLSIPCYFVIERPSDEGKLCRRTTDTPLRANSDEGQSWPA